MSDLIEVPCCRYLLVSHHSTRFHTDSWGLYHQHLFPMVMQRDVNSCYNTLAASEHLSNMACKTVTDGSKKSSAYNINPRNIDEM